MQRGPTTHGLGTNTPPATELLPPHAGPDPAGMGLHLPLAALLPGFIFTPHPALRDSIIRFKYYSAPRPQHTLISQGPRPSCPRVLGRSGIYPAASRGVAAEGQLGRVFLPRRSRIPREHPGGCGEAALEPAAAPRLVWPQPNSCCSILLKKKKIKKSRKRHKLPLTLPRVTANAITLGKRQGKKKTTSRKSELLR